MSGNSQAVFISYASQDAEAASRICEALRAAGIEVWFDQSELRGGDAWDASIRRQIKNCALFIPVISKNTHTRGEGYFRLEWKLAVDRSHLMASDLPFLLPVVVDDTPDQEDRIPDRFREVQWTRLPGGVTPANFVERVRRLLSGELSKGPTRTASEAARVSAAPMTRLHVLASWRSNAALLVTIAVVVVALGYLVADRLVLSKRSAEVGALPGSVAQNAPATAFNPPPHSIAVLPFVNMSGDAAQDYFSDGISEELLDSLSRLNGLQVAARTSSFSFNGQNADVSTIAHKLNVGAILEGSVRRAGNTVRITVQLINAVSGFHIWSQTYDRNLVDILKLQTDVATSVAQQLKIALVGDEAEKIELGGTRIPEAYDAYLRGVQQMASGDTQQSQMNHLAALAAFDQAIALDSKYALAYAGRADSLLKVSYYEPNVNKRPGFRQEARSAAERAVALAPELGEAHLALGRVRSYEFLDIPGGGPEFDRALALAPGNARVQSGFAEFASLLGHVESALKAARWAVSLDPQNPSSYMRLAYVLNDARRYDEELEVLHHAQVLYPDSKEVGGAMAGYLLASGQAEVARQYCESPSTPMIQWGRHYCLSLAYHALGQSTDAERHLKELMALSKDGDVIPYAGIYAQWGNKPEALRWLMTAERLRDPNLILIKVDSELDPIRNEPQFKAIEARLKFPP